MLSHGHFDHAGGFAGLARARPPRACRCPSTRWCGRRRRVAFPGASPWELPTLRRRSLEAEGFEVIERRQPSLLLDGSVLITGEVDRTTDFETGHAVPRGLARRALGARSADPRRPGARRARARPRAWWC